MLRIMVDILHFCAAQLAGGLIHIGHWKSECNDQVQPEFDGDFVCIYSARHTSAHLVPVLSLLCKKDSPRLPSIICRIASVWAGCLSPIPVPVTMIRPSYSPTLSRRMVVCVIVPGAHRHAGSVFEPRAVLSAPVCISA